MENKNDWYTNKELLEKIQNLFKMFNSLEKKLEQTEKKLEQTEKIIEKYNGLRSNIGELEKALYKIRTSEECKANLQERVFKWGGWLLALLTLGFRALEVFG